MIRPSHKSTKRKKSPQRVLGQRAGGAGGGQGGGGGARGCASACERLGDSSTGRFGTGGTRRRRTAMPAACGLRPLGRSAPFGAGRSEPGPEGRGAGPAASVPPGTTLDAVLVTRGPRGPSARAELSPAPPPPPTQRGGRGPGRSVGRQPALRTRSLPASGGGIRRPAEWPEWRAPLSPHRKAAASPPRGEGGEQATGRDSIPCRSRAKRTLVVFRFRQMSPNRWRHSSPPRAPGGGRTAAAEASLAFSVQSLSCPKRCHLPTMPPAPPAPQRSPQVSPWGRVCSRRGPLPCSPQSRPLLPALSPRPAAPRAPGGSTLFL